MRKLTAAIALLLTFAIPLQGFAAALQSGCALGHHRTDPSATMSHSHDGHHDKTVMHAGDATLDTDSDKGALPECKCGVCGFGTALPGSRTDTALAPPHAAPLARFVDLPVVMITGGPERPPRNILA